jgi:tetratricopeptide (TPR) repeat protein
MSNSAPSIQQHAYRNNEAAVYLSAGSIVDAIRLFEQILKERESTFRADYSDTLTARNNLAEAYREAGQPDDAIRLHDQTLKLLEVKFGANHPATLRTRDNLAEGSHTSDRSADAIGLDGQNLNCETQLGADHPHTMLAMAGLGNSYADARQFRYAIARPEEAVAQVAAALHKTCSEFGSSRRRVRETILPLLR